MGGAGGISGYQRIVRGLDYAGDVCKGKLFFPDISRKEIAICVATCPTGYTDRVCAPTEGVTDPPCWQTYPTRPVLRFCLPASPGTTAVSLADPVISGGITALVYGDLHTATPVVVAAGLLATLLGFIFLVAVQACAQCIVLTSVAGTILGTLILGAWLVMRPSQLESAAVAGFAPITYAAPFAAQLHGLGVTALVGAGCLTILFVLTRERLGSAVRLYTEASAAVAATPSLLMLPAAKALVALLVALAWASGAVYAVSAGTLGQATVSSVGGQVTTHPVSYDFGMRHTIGFLAVSGIWIIAFLAVSVDFVIAHAVSAWYFAGAQALWKADRDNAAALRAASALQASAATDEGAQTSSPSAPSLMETSDAGRLGGEEEGLAAPGEEGGVLEAVDDEGDDEEDRAWRRQNPVLRAIGVAWGYHAGSLALCALLLSVATIFRLAAEYAERSTRRQQAGRVQRVLAACVRCCAQLFLEAARFAQRHVVVVMAMYGSALRPAAQQAKTTLLREAFRVGILSSVSSWFRVVGALFVCVSTTTISYACLVSAPLYVETLASPLIPTVVIALLAYAIGAAFMGVVDMSTSTVLHCVAVDGALHGESKFAPVSLTRSVDEESGKYSDVKYTPDVA